MNGQPPYMFRGRGFEIGPVYLHHGAGNSSLAWATFSLVLLLVLAFGALLVARTASRGPRMLQRRMAFAGGPRHGPLDPLELLRIRYARGEISRDEFLQGTGDLVSSAPTEERPPESG